MNQITIQVDAYDCRECEELFNKVDWQFQLELKTNHFTDVLDEEHFCFECYKDIHTNKLQKEKCINTPPLPLTTLEEIGYECPECECVFTSSDLQCTPICNNCHEYVN